MKQYTIKDLSRPSGGLAMLAVDQREALRIMMQNATGIKNIPDETVTNFKVSAARILSPYASAVLVDKQFCLDAIVKTKAIDPSSNMIVSSDEFIPGNGIPVDDVKIDAAIDAQEVRAMGGKALKLLVLWREDEDKEECILKAAKELGDTEADIYKVEMPLGGKGSYQSLVDATAKLNDLIKMPWVILSSGVAPDLFPRAVRAAMQSGAAGFLAGRAVWSSVIGAPDQEMMLQDLAVPRLKRLSEIVDESMAAR